MYYNWFLGLGGPNGKESVQVRKGVVSQDGFDRLREADLKALIGIAFIDQLGRSASFFVFPFLFSTFGVLTCMHSFSLFHQAGIDGRGVFKEFFTSLCLNRIGGYRRRT